MAVLDPDTNTLIDFEGNNNPWLAVPSEKMNPSSIEKYTNEDFKYISETVYMKKGHCKSEEPSHSDSDLDHGNSMQNQLTPPH